MTEQSLRVSTMLKYGCHIEFIKFEPRPLADVVFPHAKTWLLQSERLTRQGYLTFSQCKCKRDLKETSPIYLLSRPHFHSEIIWGGYRRIVIFSLIRDKSNFPVFKATEQKTKYTRSCWEKMRKYALKMKEKAFLSILNRNIPGGPCPRNPLATTATAVQNPIENPVQY